MRRKIELENEVDTGLRVTYRNMTTGRVEKTDPYTLRVIGEERQQLWERPSGSGNLFDKPKDGSPVGRWIYEEKKIGSRIHRVGRYEKDAKHVEWIPPQTEDQKLAHKLADKDQKILALERELEAIKAEKNPQKKKDQGA